MSPSLSIRSYSFLSRFVMNMIIAFLLVGLCPRFSSSTSIDDSNKNNFESPGIIFDPNDYQGKSDGESPLPSIVQGSPSRLSSLRYTQPRTYANQFLVSHFDDNQIAVPKWFSKFDSDDQTNDMNNYDYQDLNDDSSSATWLSKRSKSNPVGKFSKLHKRKQIAKPPMEVMNEIVNSIYLKR